MGKEDLKTIIHDFVAEHLEDEKHFVVDISILGFDGGRKKILVSLDGDEGINIDVCGNISRKLGHMLEEEELIPTAYTLEVSSPGLDQPLVLLRQYKKNLGRKVQVTTNEEEHTTKKGELLIVESDHILIKEEIKQNGKGKKTTFVESLIPFANIIETKVLVSI